MRSAGFAVGIAMGFVVLLAGQLLGEVAPSVAGTWIARNDQIYVRAELRSNGTFTRFTRNAMGSETVQGTYRLANGMIELKPQGAAITIKLKVRLLNANTLELKGDDGSIVQMIRQGDASAVKPLQQNPPMAAAPNNPVNKPAAANPSVTTAAKKGGAAATYSVYHYIDQGPIRDPRTGGPIEGLSILVPKGWQFTGGIRWISKEKPANALSRTDLLNPTKYDFAISSPDGRSVFRQYPVEYWVQTNAFPPGHNYSGMIVCAALTPEQYITQFIIPRQRGLKAVDMKIANQQPQNELAARYEVESKQFAEASGGAAKGNALTFKAGSVTIDYTENQVAYRERFVCIQQYMQTAGMIMWWPRLHYSMRAPRDQFDAQLPVFTTIVASAQVNPYWSIGIIKIRDHVNISLAKADAYANKVRREIAASHSQTNHELAKAGGYLSGDYYDYKGTDGKLYNLPTDKYHFMNANGEIRSQDDSVPPSSDWKSIEPYNQ